jgi:peptidoglycan/xylan/chitin deacetylase (PgdA/CDA1 family)
MMHAVPLPSASPLCLVCPRLFPIDLAALPVYYGARMVCIKLPVKYLAFIALCFIPASLLFGEPSDGLIVEHGSRAIRSIALTFDACPTALPDEYDAQIIEVLLRENVPATLFLSGRWVQKNAEKAKLLASHPQFELANHAFWHPYMLEKDDERIVRELKQTQAGIKKITGKTPKYFRPPFGEVDDRLARLAQQQGLTTIQFDIASGDPDPGLSAARIARTVLRDARNGSIIVFHMNRHGVHTAEALPEIIRGLRKKGFTLVTVGELLKK